MICYFVTIGTSGWKRKRRTHRNPKDDEFFVFKIRCPVKLPFHPKTGKSIQKLQFQNHPQRNMKRKFNDFVTLLTSTEKLLLTRAGFELEPLGTPVERRPYQLNYRGPGNDWSQAKAVPRGDCGGLVPAPSSLQCRFPNSRRNVGGGGLGSWVRF